MIPVSEQVKTALESLAWKLELSYQKEETEMFRKCSDPVFNPDGWRYHADEYRRILSEVHDFRYHLSIVEEGDFYVLKDTDKLVILCKAHKDTGDLYSIATGEVVANLLDWESRKALLEGAHYNIVL